MHAYKRKGWDCWKKAESIKKRAFVCVKPIFPVQNQTDNKKKCNCKNDIDLVFYQIILPADL